jgi:V8-like Glu-specific endopeptidase
MRSVVAAFLSACVSAVSADLCTAERKLVTFGSRIKETVQVTADSPLDDVKRQDARHIRLRIKAQAPGSCDWKLMLRDERFRPVQLLAPADLPRGRTVWSARIFGSRAYLDLLDCPPGSSGPDVQSDQHIWLPKKSENPQYSIKDKNGTADWKPLGLSGLSATQMRQGDSVGMLLATTADETTNWTCSGVLVADDLFLTNWHCIERLSDHNAGTMQGLIIDMGWDGDSTSQDYQVLALEHGEPSLDFAFLKVAPRGKDGAARPVALRRAAPVEEDVSVVHHPEGQEKMISASGCRVVKLNYPTDDAPSLSHTCDTTGGSSGAPVFDRAGHVMALHFCGFNEANDVNRFNRAVRIDRIVAWLNAKKDNGDAKAREILARLRFE